MGRSRKVTKVVDVVVDAEYPIAPQELYKLMFDSDFFVDFLETNQKVHDLTFEEWQPRESDNSLFTRKFQYVKPLHGPIGPKQVLCLEVEENQHFDPNDYISTETTTHTPDVPYGKSFHVVTRTSIAWNVDRERGSLFNVTSEVVWTGSCPFKGMVEGRAISGQKDYARDMNTAVREHLSATLQLEDQDAVEKREKGVHGYYTAPSPPFSDNEKEMEWGNLVPERQRMMAGRWRRIHQLFILVSMSILLTLFAVRLMYSDR